MVKLLTIFRVLPHHEHAVYRTYLNMVVVFMVSTSSSLVKEDNDDEGAVFIFRCCLVVFLILVLIPSAGYAAYSSNYYNQIQRMGSGTSTVDFTDAYSEIAGFVDTLTGLEFASVFLTIVKPTIASVIVIFVGRTRKRAPLPSFYDYDLQANIYSNGLCYIRSIHRV